MWHVGEIFQPINDLVTVLFGDDVGQIRWKSTCVRNIHKKSRGVCFSTDTIAEEVVPQVNKMNPHEA